MSQTQTKLLSSVPAISSLAEGDKITVVTATGQTALVSLSNLQSIMRAGMSAGRNLAKDSAYVEVSPTHRQQMVQITDNLRPGDVITICADDIVITGEDSDMHQSVYLDIYAKNADYITYAGLSRGSSKTLTLPSKSFAYDEVSIYIYAKMDNNNPVKDTVKIYGLSVVRGAVAPLRWAPAPEDLNWGGVISSFSEVSKESARISKKGGLLHEYIDNYADKGSHRCNPEGYTLRCTGGPGASCRYRRMPNPRVLLLRSFVHRPSIVPNRRVLLSANNEIQRHSGTSTLPRDGECYDSLQNCKHSERYRKCEMEEDKLLVYRLALGKEVAA